MSPPLPDAVSQPRLTQGLTDVNGPIWRHGAFHRDTWTKAQAADPLPDTPVLVSAARWRQQRDHLLLRAAPIGLLIEPGDILTDCLDDLAPDLSRFPLIALDFPKLSDGRAFSLARLLREKHGFTGELRAVGHVLNDQIPFMFRVGFDSLEVTHAPTRAALAAGHLAQVTLYYQPVGIPEASSGTRPWLRRAAR